MTWILVICTQAWGLCGLYREVPYPDEPACYKALDKLYEKHGREHFKYLLCRPSVKEEKK